MTAHLLQVESVPIDRLFCSPTNPRRNEAAVPHVEASIRRFGFQQPIVAKRSGEVIAGNTRLKATQRLQLPEVPVVWFDANDLEATAYQIADNRSAEFAEWDEPALAKLLQQLKAEDAAQDIGFSTSEIDELLGQLATEAEGEDPGPEAPPPQPITRLGDLWQLGEHRLLCGDSTNEADVLKVMSGEQAALVATDPPYLVDYTGERPNDSGKDWTDNYREIDIKDADAFFRALFTNILRVLAPNAAIYTWHAHKRQATIARIWEELGILDHQQIVWVKPTPVFGRVYWHFRHEPCMMGWRQGSKPEHDGQHEFDSVWEIDWEGKQRIVGNEHPCLHPDALVLTNLGWRPISTMLVGERVMAADGAFHRLSDVSSHRYTSKALVRVTVLGVAMTVLASDNHPFLVWRAGEVGWVRADELRVGDCTMTPLPAERFMEGSGISGVGFAGCTHVLRPITSIERVPYSGDVWNLSVDGCPSFQTSVGMSHNTQKPVEIFARPMRKHTKPGDVVFEPFSGSGSQLIASEQLRRKCRAIEISPAFVDVGLRRWEKATKREAVLAATGQSFAQVAAERKPS
jgi:DNA modification methylase